MFEDWKRKYIDWQSNNLWKKTKSTREKKFLNWSDVNRVVVLVSYDIPHNEEISNIIKMLDNKEVEVWCNITTKQYLRQDYDKVTFFNSESTNLFGKPNKVIEGKFLSFNADVLIDLTSGENLPLKYLLKISRAVCKCGQNKEFYQSLYDLEISANGKLTKTELLSQILHYLKTIMGKRNP